MASIHPLSKLYNDLNGKLGDDDDSKLRNILTGQQISKRDMQSLKDPAAIFRKLDEHGHIGEDDLQFLKDILRSIDRSPLIGDVLECEIELHRMKELRETQKKVLEQQELEEKLLNGAVENGTNVGITSALGATGFLDYTLSSIKGSGGQIEYMGRAIKYESKGRFHTLLEFVFDGKATDVATGISRGDSHFETADKAVKAAVRLLIDDLKSQGIIKAQ